MQRINFTQKFPSLNKIYETLRYHLYDEHTSPCNKNYMAHVACSNQQGMITTTHSCNIVAQPLLMH